MLGAGVVSSFSALGAGVVMFSPSGVAVVTFDGVEESVTRSVVVGAGLSVGLCEG